MLSKALSLANEARVANPTCLYLPSAGTLSMSPTSQLIFFNMGPGNGTQVLMLARSALYQLSHRPSPNNDFLNFKGSLRLKKKSPWPIFMEAIFLILLVLHRSLWAEHFLLRQMSDIFYCYWFDGCFRLSLTLLLHTHWIVRLFHPWLYVERGVGKKTLSFWLLCQWSLLCWAVMPLDLKIRASLGLSEHILSWFWIFCHLGSL